MLNPVPNGKDQGSAQRRRRESGLWHDEARHTPSFGCLECPERNICGGLQVGGALYSCLDNCCGRSASCDRVCRMNSDLFVARLREVGGFDLETLRRAPVLLAPVLPVTVPIVFHGSRRERPAPAAVVCLPLYEMIDRREGRLRFASRKELCGFFGLDRRARIVLTGTERDPPLERWWELGAANRGAVIRGLIGLGVELATTPNYSLFVDRPRWDDLHAMKRIALIHQEFQEEGLPAALHVNGRTDRDFARWTDYIAGRNEISHIAYEFGTGTGRNGRRELHAKWLCEMALQVGRPLDLVVRGGMQVVPTLASAFRRISVFDSSVFMKTMKRQRGAWAPGGNRVTWRPAPTPEGAALDGLFAANLAVVDAALRDFAAPPRPAPSKAVAGA